MKSIYKENIFELYWINMNYVNLGIKFKTARIKLDYNQEYVAEMMGVGQRYISKIEHGLARPEFATICKLANLLGV